MKLTGEGSAKTGERKILIVDDDVTLSRLLGETLSREGYDIVTAADGEEGVAAALNHKPDLIISDILMSAMDGWEFCRTLRSLPSMKTIPFIFLTSLNKAPEKMKAMQLGADEYITKPFKLDDLLAKLGGLVGRLEGREEVLQGKKAHGIGDMAANILVDTLEYLRASTRTGSLTVTGGPHTGVVFIEEGAVRHVSYGSQVGEMALYALLDLKESRVAFTEGERGDLDSNFPLTLEKFMSSLLESDTED